MSAKAESLGSLVNTVNATWLYPENHQGTKPFEGPGIVTVNDGNGNTGVVAVKHPRYRPYGNDVTGVFTGDCVTLVDSTCQGEPYPIGYDRLQGVEAEFNIADPDGNPRDLYPEDKPLPVEGLEEHPELLRFTFETDGAPSPTTAGAYRHVRKSVEKASEGLQPFDGLIDPASAFMQRVPTFADITPNPYVGVMARTLGPALYESQSDTVKFIGTGIHEHFDLHVGYAPLVAGYLRLLAPYLNLGLQAAPFGFGELTPRLGEILGSDEIAQYDGKQPQSVRYPTRSAASPNGGVGLLVVHDNLTDALSHADLQLTRGEISNPARLYGSHADVRARFDAPSPKKPKHPGRVELCVKDTAALRWETLEPYGELTRGVVDQLERVAAAGERGLKRLHDNFPNLFGPSYDTESMATKLMPRTHQNALAIAYYGADALVINGSGREVTAREHFSEIVKFVNRGRWLPHSVVKVLNDSVASTAAVEGTAKHHLDEKGLPSLQGYYETGVGTASQWMIVRAAAAAALGFTPADNMRLGTIDRANSFKSYLAQA